jgi:hypothetical protein
MLLHNSFQPKSSHPLLIFLCVDHGHSLIIDNVILVAIRCFIIGAVIGIFAEVEYYNYLLHSGGPSCRVRFWA